MGRDADSGNGPGRNGIHSLDRSQIPAWRVLCGVGTSQKAGGTRAVLENPQSDLCLWFICDRGNDSCKWEAGVAADFCPDHSAADLAGAERVGGAGGGVWRGISQVSSKNVVLMVRVNDRCR